MLTETARINFEATNLDVVEGRIKAIGGAINVLGGSIEVVVGTMGLIGIDEKVTKQFQEAATSAIAFADGAKRVFEGYKELREASELFRKAQAAGTVVTVANTTATAANNTVQTASVGVLGKVRVAFNALTAAMLRNPITAIVVGLTALVAALVTFSDEAEEATDTTAELNKELRDLEISASEEIASIQNLGTITQNTNVSIEARRRLYQDLQQKIPILKNLTLEEAIATGRLNVAIKDQIALINLQTKAKSNQLVLDRTQKSLLDALDLTRLNAQQKAAILAGDLSASEIQNLAPKLQGQGGLVSSLSGEIAKLRKNLNDLTIEIAGAKTLVEEPQKKSDTTATTDAQKQLEALEQFIKSVIEKKKEADRQRVYDTLDAVDAEFKALEDAYNDQLKLIDGFNSQDLKVREAAAVAKKLIDQQYYADAKDLRKKLSEKSSDETKKELEDETQSLIAELDKVLSEVSTLSDKYYDSAFSGLNTELTILQELQPTLAASYNDLKVQTDAFYDDQKRRADDYYTKEILRLDKLGIDSSKVKKDQSDVLAKIEKDRQETQTKITEAYIEKRANLEEKANEDIKSDNEKVNDALGYQRDISRNKELEAMMDYFDELEALYKGDADNLEKITKAKAKFLREFAQVEIVNDLKKLQETITSYAQLASTAISSMSQIQQSNQEKRLNEIEAYYQNMAQNVVGSEAEVADQLARIEAEKNDKMEKLKEEFFENQKKYRIAEVTITGLQGAFAAFVQASSTIPPPAGQIVGGVLAGLVLTAMAAQISQIKKQKYIRGSVGAGVGGGAANIGGRGGTNLGNISGGNFLQPIPNPGDPGNRTGASQNNFGFMSAPNTSPNTPIRAYVVASDVETGLEAERALNSRRRL